MPESNPESNPRPGWQQKLQSDLQDVASQAENDLRRVIAYINDDVVPDLRRNGIEAMRAAATELHRLASRLDDRASNASSTRDPRPGDPSRRNPGSKEP